MKKPRISEDQIKVFEFGNNLTDQTYDEYVAIYFETKAGEQIEKEYIRIVQNTKHGLACALLTLFLKAGNSLDDMERIIKDIKAGHREDM